jgi:hypothetical protein
MFFISQVYYKVQNASVQKKIRNKIEHREIKFHKEWYKEKELQVHKQRTKAEICETAWESFSQTTVSSTAKFCERF